MNRYCAFLLSLACGTAAVAQPDSTHWRIDGPANLFTTDELGHLYLLKGNDLFLYDRNGKLVARNSFNAFGPISSIDAFPSLKPMIFSSDQGQMALLDNTLSFRGSAIDLARAGFPWVDLACTGVQDRFWFFNERDLTLVRVDGRLNMQNNSGRLDQVLGFAPQPTYMEETDDRLYLVDPANGVLVFDLFGTFVRTLPITGVDRVQVREGMVWYVRDGALNRYDLRSFATDTVPWPAGDGTTTVMDARLEQGRLYRQTPNSILVDRIAP